MLRRRRLVMEWTRIHQLKIRNVNLVLIPGKASNMMTSMFSSGKFLSKFFTLFYTFMATIT